MVFLGLEKPVEYGRQLIFDPTTALMVLLAQDQYANALYRDYVRGLEDMKEFNKEYGNFITPILADQEWYNKNVIDKVRGTILRMYDAGIDPTRSVQGRAAITQLINSIDVGSINKLRSSAANAEEFLKARKQLEAQGLYNPLLAKYDGPDINTYSTLDRIDENGNVVSGSGVWDKMSPTRITDMATFGNPYFEGMKPNVIRKSKDGVEYSVEKIDENDLRAIADAHFNELVSTPQGQLMYKYYRDLAGGDANPDSDIQARLSFNNAVVDGQRRRIYEKSDYDDNYYKSEQLKLSKRDQALRERKANWDMLMDMAQYNVDENGNPLPSAGGYGDGGGSTGNSPALGANTSLATDSPLQYMTNRRTLIAEYEKENDRQYKKLNSAYDKLLKRDKEIADEYKMQYEIYLDDNSSKEDKKQAAEFIKRANAKRDPNFVAWRNAYKPVIKGAQQKWIENNTIGGLSGSVEQSEEQTYKNSLKLYENNYMVKYDAGLYSDLDKNLPYRTPSENSEDLRPYAFAGRNAVFQPIPMLEIVQGGKLNRWYRKGDAEHSGYVRKIASIINGKKFFEDTDNINRKWGSGLIKGVRRNVANETVIFEDADVVNSLNKIPDNILEGLNITKVQKDGTTKAYKIPITHIVDPNMGWASVDNVTHKRQTSLSEAAKIRPLDQARLFLAQVNP